MSAVSRYPGIRTALVTLGTAVLVGAVAPVVVASLGVAQSNVVPGQSDCNTVEACSTPTASAGAISGTVTDGSSAPLQGICVYINPGGGNLSSNNSKEEAITTSTGEYDIADVPAGSYAVEFTATCGSTGNYAPVWFSGATTEANSTPVEVAVGKVTAEVDARLAAGGSISGTVTNPSAAGISGVCVSILLPGNSYQPVATTTTDGSGNYQVQSLATGIYDVEFDPACHGSVATAYGTLYYSSATTQAAATAISVTAGSPTSNIDQQLPVSPQRSFGSASISGTLLDPSSNPVQNACVEAFVDGSTPYGAAQAVQVAPTDTTGAYTVSDIGPGQYDLEFDPYCYGSNTGSPPYEIAWWNGTAGGASSQSGAVPVDVTSTSQTLTGYGATLAEATGTVSGTVTDSTPAAVAGVCVSIQDPNSPSAQPATLFSDSATTQSDGTYSIPNVPVGTWDVFFEADCVGSTYANQWYSGTGSPDSATTVTVSSGATTSNVNATLSDAGSLRGAVNANCATVSCFVEVSVFAAGGTDVVGSFGTQLTGTSQPYSIGNLAQGYYSVQFGVFGNNGGGSDWYNGSQSEGGGSAVAVVAGSATNNIDGSFGSLSGTVTDNSSPPNDLSGCEVELTPHGGTTVYESVQTGANGTYSFGVVPTGQYDVDFGYNGSRYDSCNLTTYDGQWWTGTAGGASSQAGASPATVSASADTSPIDAALAPSGTSAPGAISGKVTNGLGDPAPLICVDVYPSGSPPAADYEGETYLDGTYTVGGLPSGSYDVEFDPSCAGQYDPGYTTQWWDDAFSSGSSTAVTVGTATVPNIDDSLPLSPTTPPGPAPGATSSTSASSTGSPPTAVATNQGTTVTGNGVGALTVSQYPTDPVGAPSFASANEYLDVDLSHSNTFSSVVIDDCNVGGGQGLDWWNPSANSGAGAWEPVTGNPGPTFTPGSPNCVSVTLDTTTSPTLAQMTGTVFGVVDGPGPYTPLPPTRICDTRPANPSSLSGDAAQCNGGVGDAGTTLGSQGTLTITVAGQFGVPADATAVVLNVTVVPQDPGYLTVYPAGQTLPTASNLNYTRGDVVPNLVEVGVGADGQASIYSYAPTDVIVDLEGFVAPTSGLGTGGGLYNTLASPARICDTRSGNPSGLSGTDAQCNGKTMTAGSTLDVQVTGAGNVPGSGVSAVVLNVTVVGPVGPGYLTVWPEDVSPKPTASNLNYQVHQVVPNRVIVPVSTTGPNLGQVSIYSTTATDVLVDVSGWYSASGGSTGSKFSAETKPVRVCDTRSGNPSGLSSSYAQCNSHTLGPAGSISVQVTGLGSVPVDATAVVLNVTSVLPSNFTYVTVYPQAPVPVVSDLNPYPGEVEPNLVVATLSGTGTVDIYNAAGNNDVVVDVLGWYS